MLRDSAWATVSLTVPAVTHLMVRLYVGRELGQDALGLYSLAFAAYSIAMVFGTLGTGTALTRHVAQVPTRPITQDRLLLVGVAQSALAGAAVAFMLAILSRPLSCNVFGMPQMHGLLLITSFALPGAAVGKAVLGYLNGRRRFGWYAVVSVTQSALIIVITFGLISAGYGVTGAMAGFLVPISFTGLASLSLGRRAIGAMPKSSPQPRFSSGIIRFGLFVTMINSVGVLQSYTDTVMTGAFLNERELGAYAASLLVLEALRFPSTAVRLALTPRIASMWSSPDVAELTRVVNLTIACIATIVIPLGFAIIIGAESLLYYGFGQGFESASTALIILVPGGMSMGVWSAVGALLSVTGHVRTAFKYVLGTAAANAALNVVLIPSFGITGAAIATTTTLCLGCLLQTRAVQHKTGVTVSWKRPVLTGSVLTLGGTMLALVDVGTGSFFHIALWWLGATCLCGAALLPWSISKQLVQWLARPR